MTLAARCPTCRTAFRVVRDQLRVSEGWVRCGRCAAVFDATQTLFEVEGQPAAQAPAPTPSPPSSPAVSEAPPTPPAQPPSQQPPEQPAEAVADASPPATDAPAAAPTPSVWNEPAQPAALSVDDLHAALFGPQPSDAALPIQVVAPAEAVQTPRDDHAGLELDLDLIGRSAAAVSAPEPQGGLPAAAFEQAADDPTRNARAAASGATGAGDANDRQRPDPVLADGVVVTPAPGPERGADAPAVEVGARPLAPTTPAFVRKAERAARWRSTPVRLALGSAALLLSGAAVLQGARAFHDPIAVHWPAARPVLATLCGVVGCDTSPRRHIEGLRVESSALIHVDGDSQRVRLTLTLRNRHPLPVQPPAVELTLTDARGNIVSRRVLQPAQLGVRTDRIAPGAELPMQAVLDTGALRVVGYTLEIFYP